MIYIRIGGYKLGNKKKFKSNFIWNVLGTGINAFNSLFFLITVTRINGIDNAGVFTFAFSTACILYVIGTYAGRIFQVTDTNKDIKDKEYILNRIISCISMLILAVIFVLFKRYNFYKSIILILLTIYKSLEAFCDVLYGILQKNNNLDMVGKSYFIKGLFSVVGFVILDIITKNVIISSVTVIFIWILVLVFYDINKTRSLIDFKQKINIKNVFGIFKSGFFVFFITFLGLYILNAPKYAIDSFLTDDKQAIFGIVIMPATIMALIGQFLIHPYLNEIVKLYNENSIKSLKKLTIKIALYILIFGVIASICAYLIGIPVLNLVYGIDLNEFRIHLVAIIIAATLYNIGILYSSVLTTIRKTFIQSIIYIIVSFCALSFSNILTIKFGLDGAVIDYFLIMTIHFILYIIISNIIIKKYNNKI